MRAPAAHDEIEDAFLDDLAAGQRPAGQLQARDRSERGELGFLEFVQNLLGPEMDFDRQRNEGLGAAIDRLGRRPGQQHEDGVRLELADARRGLGQIAIENGAPFLDRRGGDHRRQEAAADDVDAELPGLVAVDEGADIGAGADQKDALRRQ